MSQLGADRYFRSITNIRLDLLELFGRSYVMDYAESQAYEYAKRDVTVEYIAEAVRLAVNNTAGSEKRYTLEKPLHDLLKREKTETRTEDEVIDSIKQKLAKLGA